MNILIIEDEARIARRLARMTQAWFKDSQPAINFCEDLNTGLKHIDKHPVDLLLLDLNLNGENGFDVLEKVVARSFQTIIVSAYTEKAITAFAYGVLDFVPKPFDEERLYKAFERLQQTNPTGQAGLRYLAVRNAGIIKMIPVEAVQSIHAAGNYSELQLANGNIALHDKSLDALEKLLTNSTFIRIHRAHIIRQSDIAQLRIEPGGRYAVTLRNGEQLPVGRSRYPALKEKFNSK